MNCHLLIQSNTYPLAGIKSCYYDLQQSYAFEACLMLKELFDFRTGTAAQVAFGEKLCLPVEISQMVVTPCLGGVQIVLALVSPLQAQKSSHERYFVNATPAQIVAKLLKEENLSWQLQISETQTPMLPFFRQSEQTLSQTVVDLLQQLQWGQLFSLKNEAIIWQVGSIGALASTHAVSELPVSSEAWGSQFGEHAYAVSSDSRGQLVFESNALYWPVGSQIAWQGRQFLIVAMELFFIDNRVTLGDVVSKNKNGVKTQAVALEKLRDYFLKKHLDQQGWAIATIEGQSEGSAVNEKGCYRVSMQQDELSKSKHHRSPDLLRLHAFMNQSEGLHWPLHEGVTVMTAFCDDESVPVIVGPILSETIDPKVTSQNAQSHALTTPGGSHWIVNEDNEQLQFGTPGNQQRFAFERDNIIMEAKESGITQQIATTYTLVTESELLWQAGTLLACQIETEWHSDNESQQFTAETGHFMAEKEMKWFLKSNAIWDVQGLCRWQVKALDWQAERRLVYHAMGRFRLQAASCVAHAATNLSVTSGQSTLKLALGRIQLTGTRCLLQAPIIQISAGCQTAIRVKY